MHRMLPMLLERKPHNALTSPKLTDILVEMAQNLLFGLIKRYVLAFLWAELEVNSRQLFNSIPSLILYFWHFIYLYAA